MFIDHQQRPKLEKKEKSMDKTGGKHCNMVNVRAMV